jgi:AcrR family transcriptional regulator
VGKPPPSGRLVRERRIYRATLEELASADYGTLSYENVAKRAGVNKTTLYRRWPAKADLVGRALLALSDEMLIGPSSGAIRDDLIEIGRRYVTLALSLEGQGLARLALLREEPELVSVVAQLRRRREQSLERLLAAAVERGELAKGTDLSLLLDMLGGLLHVRLFLKPEREVDEHVTTRAVDILLRGVLEAPQRRTTQRKPR